MPHLTLDRVVTADWIEDAKAAGWDVLLDLAAFCPTNQLDLRKHRPDFLSVSFYKMFGYPTGEGLAFSSVSLWMLCLK